MATQDFQMEIDLNSLEGKFTFINMTKLNLKDIRERCENPSAEFLEKVTEFSGYSYTGLEFIDPIELSKSFAKEFDLPALLDWVERARQILQAIDDGNLYRDYDAEFIKQLLSELEP